MGMCAIRGSLVSSGGGVEEDSESLTPRSGMSSSSSISSASSDSSQELEVGGEPAAPPAALWQRTIPRGRRCRPLSFSGLIIYDATGNQLDYCPRLTRETREDRIDDD